jgi:hypothetical protein
MATHNSSKCHAAQLVSTLSINQRNALRVILAQEHECMKLRRALGTHETKIVSEQERCAGLARTGRTIELFDRHRAAASIRHRH